jgi:hypothetical protein
LISGVTTVVDGGSSGAMTFEGLKQFISLKSSTRVLVHFSFDNNATFGRFFENNYTFGTFFFKANNDSWSMLSLNPFKSMFVFRIIF